MKSTTAHKQYIWKILQAQKCYWPNHINTNHASHTTTAEYWKPDRYTHALKLTNTVISCVHIGLDEIISYYYIATCYNIYDTMYMTV